MLMDDISRYVADEDDLAFEYELQRTPQSVVTWRRYLDSWKEDGRPDSHVVWLYERFCGQFQSDVEVWQDYIQWLLERCGKSVEYTDVMELFVRSLSYCAKNCEDLCIKFLEFAIGQLDLKYIRMALDISLKRLPRDGHGRVWEKVLRFIDETLSPLTRNEETEYDDVFEELSILIYKGLFEKNDESTHELDLWTSLILKRYLDVCPSEQRPLNVIRIAQTGDHEFLYTAYRKFYGNGPQSTLPYSTNLLYLESLESLNKPEAYEQFITELAGVFPENWVELKITLVKFYIKSAQHDKIVKVFGDSLARTQSVQEFSMLYSTYLNYEKAFIDIVLQELKNKSQVIGDWEQQVESHLSRLQGLIDSYEIRINDIKIRRNPNLVSNWSERATLFPTAAEKCDVYSHAILTIDPYRVNIPGSLGKLWCAYAELYWEAGDFDSAREVYDRGLRVPYPYLQDLEELWTTWAEHELENFTIESAIKLMENALQVPENPELLVDRFKEGDKKVPAQAVVFTSLKLWLLYLDFTESLSYDSSEYTEKTIALYEQMIALKVATPMVFINYAHFLQEHREKLSSFQVYERAIGTFPPETQLEIWDLYLTEGTAEDSPLAKEQIRDLFDQALQNLTNGRIDCKTIFLLYSDFEEQCGLLNRCCEILLQGARKTANLEDKITLWQMCISKAKALLGNEESRALYEECIQSLPNSQVMKFVVDFALTEAVLGEIERARELFKYGAQLLPPGRNGLLWEKWDEFEVRNGNKESYKDMLKLKRKLEKEMRIETEAESQLEGNIAFVAASKQNVVNPEEIELNI